MRTADRAARGWVRAPCRTPPDRGNQSPRRRGGLAFRDAPHLGSGPARRVRLVLARHRRLLTFLVVLVALWGTIRAAAPPAQPTVAVAVASHDLPAGRVITADDVQLATWPAKVAPSSRISTAGVTGHILATAVSSGEAITTARLLGPGLLAGQPAGDVAITVRLADPAALAPIRPGDRVDVLASSATDSWDATPASAPSDGTAPAQDDGTPAGAAQTSGSGPASDSEAGAERLAEHALVLATPGGSSPDASGDNDWAAGALGSATGTGGGLTSSSDASGPAVLVLAVGRDTATRLAGAASSRPFSIVLLPAGP